MTLNSECHAVTSAGHQMTHVSLHEHEPTSVCMQGTGCSAGSCADYVAFLVQLDLLDPNVSMDSQQWSMLLHAKCLLAFPAVGSAAHGHICMQSISCMHICAINIVAAFKAIGFEHSLLHMGQQRSWGQAQWGSFADGQLGFYLLLQMPGGESGTASWNQHWSM